MRSCHNLSHVRVTGGLKLPDFRVPVIRGRIVMYAKLEISAVGTSEYVPPGTAAYGLELNLSIYGRILRRNDPES